MNSHKARYLIHGCPRLYCNGTLCLDEDDPEGSYDCSLCSRPFYREYPNGPPASDVLFFPKKVKREAVAIYPYRYPKGEELIAISLSLLTG